MGLVFLLAIFLLLLLWQLVWRPETLFKKVHQRLGKVLLGVLVMDEVPFIWVDLEHGHHMTSQ